MSLLTRILFLFTSLLFLKMCYVDEAIRRFGIVFDLTVRTIDSMHTVHKCHLLQKHSVQTQRKTHKKITQNNQFNNHIYSSIISVIDWNRSPQNPIVFKHGYF